MTTKLEKKEVAAIPVISLSTSATINTIMDAIGVLPDEIMQECQELGIEPMGPFVFVYRGCDGNKDTAFELEMAIPVKADLSYSGKYQFKTLEAFQFVEQRYTGPISEIESKGYVPLMAAMQEQGLLPGSVSREVYSNWVEPESAENIVELQIGI